MLKKSENLNIWDTSSKKHLLFSIDECYVLTDSFGWKNISYTT